jgi:putative DNA primase/helicase
VGCDPPIQLLQSILAAAGEWRGIRQIIGLSTTPILREDGTIHLDPGYDEETRLVYLPSSTPPVMPSHPSKDDALEAARKLLEVVRDFPFVDDTHRTGWLAACLTPLARPLCPCVPMFVFDAATAGSGKSLLTDSISEIVAGRAMSKGPFVAHDEEMRKRIFTHAIAGDVLILIDNAPGGCAVGWPSLDLTLTATSLTDRVLGESRRVESHNVMCWFVTGNNLSIRGDTGRRTLHIRLESQLERPELRPRSDFLHPDLLEWVAEERANLLGAALTVLSTYLQAEQPSTGLHPLGSFEPWSRVVRDALAWLGLGDVAELVASQDEEADPRDGAHRQLLDELTHFPEGLSASDMIEQATCSLPNVVIRDALLELCPSKGGVFEVRRVGFALRELRNRVKGISGGRAAKLVRLGKSDDSHSKKAVRWGAKLTGNTPLGGIGGHRGYALACAHGMSESHASRVTHIDERLTDTPDTPVYPPDDDTPRREHLDDQQDFFGLAPPDDEEGYQ